MSKKQSPPSKIAVIGAGYTGLTAAYRLASMGYNVEVFEAGKGVGGLAGDFTIEGEPLEIAYHHLFKTDTDIINLTRELGIEKKLKWHDSSVALYYDNQLYPFMTPFDLIKFKPLRFINRIRAGLVVLYLQKSNNWQKLTGQTAYSWMKKYAGPQVSQVIWEPLLRGKFANYYNKVSMAWLWARIHIRANSREKGDQGEKLGYFDGGFKVLTDTLVAACKKQGVHIHTNVKIDSISSANDGPAITIAGKNKKFDKVICTTPSGIFARLVEHSISDKKYLAKLAHTKYLGALLMIFSSEQEISPYYWHNINDINKSFLVFIHHTRLVDKKRYSNKHVYYIGAYLPHDHKLMTMSDKDLEKTWFKELKDIFPHFSEKEIRQKYIFHFKNAQHIVDTDYLAHMPEHRTPLQGVYLSNFSQIFPEDRGTNYAVREGNKIATMVDEDINAHNEK